MHLIQILLPLNDNRGKAIPSKLFHEVKRELTRCFKGLTVYSRSPAEGIWKPRKGTKRDEIIVFEVMAPTLDRPWWEQYRKRLEAKFQQESIVIRDIGAILL
jgi:hypothetical protein